MDLTLLIYLILAIIVVFTSICLSNIIDKIDRNTKISSVFLGSVMLAIVTSLPELFTTLSAVVFLDQPSMAYGNILGSNLFDLAIMSFFILFTLKLFYNSILDKIHIKTTIYCLLIFSVLVFGSIFDSLFVIPFININVLSFIIAFICIVAFNFNAKSNDKQTCCKIYIKSVTNIAFNLKKNLIYFALFSIVLIVSSCILSFVASDIAEKFELSEGFAGMLFLGIATSLPEIISTLNLIKLKNYNLAYGNIIGSILFNLFILVIADVFYFNGTIFTIDNALFILTIICFFSCLLMLLILITKNDCFKWQQKKLAKKEIISYNDDYRKQIIIYSILTSIIIAIFMSYMIIAPNL